MRLSRQCVWRPLGLAMAMLVMLVSHSAMAKEPTAYQMTPMGYAAEFERVTVGSSTETLEAYGRNALALTGHERLKRLYKISVEFQSLGDMARFAKWNAELFRIATQEHNKRFVDLSRQIKAVMAYYQGDDHQIPVLTAIEQQSDDWLVRNLVQGSIAFMTANANNSQDGLRRLNAIRADIRQDDPDKDLAEKDYWRKLSVFMFSLYDLEGGVKAMAHAYFGESGARIPSPNVGSISNLTLAAISLGQEDLARRAYQAELHIARQSGDPLSMLSAAANCANIESAFQHAEATLRCLHGVDIRKIRPSYVAVPALIHRGLAHAQLGHMALATADRAELKAMAASGDYNAFSFGGVELIDAQLLVAKGDAKGALAMTNAYYEAMIRNSAQEFRQSVGQLTGLLQSDVNNLRRNAELQETVIRFQWLLGGLAVLVVGAATYAIISLRRLNREYASARRVAEEANAAKSLFLANISHEIRTPLNGILGLAQAIGADELSPAQAERLDVLRRSGLGLLTILNDLLDLAKIEAGKLTLEAIPFNPDDALIGARYAFWAAAKAKGLTVETRIEQEAQGMYLGDPTRMRQIVDNLVSNAVKFTTEGKVEVILSRPDQALVLTVRDTGIGMTPDAASRIFAKFEQADATTTRRFGGTGLGLSICLELAEAMGGTIAVESAPGVGTTFTVTLPLERLGDVEAHAPAPEPEALTVDEEAPLRVLAAEDHPVNQLVLRTLLGLLGIEVTLVGDGAQVVEQYQAQAWDVILMDVQMPVMDGPAATRAIRSLEAAGGLARTPIIALTANSMAHQVAEYRLAGFDDHVSKPIDAADLAAAINRVLAQAEELTPERQAQSA